MKKHTYLGSKPGIFLCLLVFGISGLLAASPAMAQTSLKSAGEVASASQVSINGRSVVAGLTIFSDSRIRTARQGKATINLGNLGRLELGPETDLMLKFSPGAIGGELLGGRVMLSASSRVSVSLTTAKTLITTDGKSATVVTVEMTNDADRVAAHLGEVRVASPGKTERVVAGEEIAFSKQQPAAGWQHRKLLAAGAGLLGTGGLIASTQVGQAATPGAIAATTASAKSLSAPLTTLINAGFNYSLANLVYGFSRDPEVFFSTTITCRDHDNVFCKRRSITTP